jgi:hypothetical protein
MAREHCSVIDVFFPFCDEPGSFINLNHHSPLQAANGYHFKRSAKKLGDYL